MLVLLFLVTIFNWYHLLLLNEIFGKIRLLLISDVLVGSVDFTRN